MIDCQNGQTGPTSTKGQKPTRLSFASIPPLPNLGKVLCPFYTSEILPRFRVTCGGPPFFPADTHPNGILIPTAVPALQELTHHPSSKQLPNLSFGNPLPKPYSPVDIPITVQFIVPMTAWYVKPCSETAS